MWSISAEAVVEPGNDEEAVEVIQGGLFGEGSKGEIVQVLGVSVRDDLRNVENPQLFQGIIVERERTSSCSLFEHERCI